MLKGGVGDFMKKVLMPTLLAFFMFFSQTSPAMMIEVPTEILVSEADAIYSGQITTVQYHKKYLSQDGSDFYIYTLVHMKVDEAIKGENLEDVTIYVSGGVVDGYDTRISVAPRFSSDESVVVFLKTMLDGRVKTLRHAQGKKVFENVQEKEEFLKWVRELANI